MSFAEAPDQILVCAKFMKVLMKKKRKLQYDGNVALI